ncbi:hypothetical protein ACFQ3N_13360 [Virgibacillus byunsanensis]|uniref:ABC transporter ATP-binding protein n=1 Tax=Virgibacillus byunsanensis TaxID=570945 RepID=A0ABW3LNH9_9BACI
MPVTCRISTSDRHRHFRTGEEVVVKIQIHNIDEQIFEDGEKISITWEDENTIVLLSDE